MRSNEPRADADAAGLASRAAFKDVVHTELTPDLVYGLPALLVSHRGSASDDSEALWIQAAELGDHLLGQPVAEVLLLRVPGQVFEGQHGQPYRLDGGCGPSVQPLPQATKIKGKQSRQEDGEQDRPRP